MVFVNGDVLCQGKVEIGQTRTAHDADSGIAECLWGGTRQREGIGVEPPFDRSLRFGQLGVSYKVRAGHAIAAKIQNRVSAESCGQRQSPLNRMNAGDLPISEEQIRGRTPRLSPMRVFTDDDRSRRSTRPE